MNKYKVRLTEHGPNEKWKTITVEASNWTTGMDGSLVFYAAAPSTAPLRGFANGEWSRVRQINAA